MDLNVLMAIVDKLTASERDQLQRHLAERSTQTWVSHFEAITREFREGLDSEFESLVTALNQKSAPSARGS